MKKRFISSIIIFPILFLTSCLTQMQIKRDERITQEFITLFDQLEKIDKEDNRYNKNYIIPRRLKVPFKKMQILRKFENRFKYKKLWDLKYSDGNQEVKYLKKGIRSSEYINIGDGECVTAVKRLTNLNKSTSSWKKGFRVVYSIILPGTVIATFDNQGNFTGHAAVYKGTYEREIEVYDQNWWYQDNYGNIIANTIKSFGTHFITGKDGEKNPNNKYNYYIVRIK